MTENEFIYSIQGFFEISGDEKLILTADQAELLKCKLDNVKSPSKFSNWLQGVFDAKPELEHLTELLKSRLCEELTNVTATDELLQKYLDTSHTHFGNSTRIC